MECETEEEFCDKYKKLKSFWSHEYVIYFENNLLEDVRRNMRGRLKAAGVTKTLTTNISESWNSVLKRAVNWKESRLDKMALTLYMITCYQSNEINRGIKDLGQYSVKAVSYTHLTLPTKRIV